MSEIKVLLVEDEEIVGKFIEKQLSSAGYIVVDLVNSGETAIERVSSLNPDIVLMDIKIMGPIDGIETADIIRKKYQVPVIFLTSLADDESFQRAILAEPFGYLIKPINIKEFKRAIELALYNNKIYKELLDTKQRFQIATESARTAVWEIWNENGNLFINPSSPEIFGYDKSYFEGKNLESMNFIFEDDIKAVTKLIRECLQGRRKNFEIEHRIYNQDRSLSWVLLRGIQVASDNNKPKRIIGSATDITERKNYEQALKKSEENFRSIFESAGVGMATLTPDGQITKVNNSFCEIMGYVEKEIIGLNLRNFTHPGDLGKWQELIKEVVKLDTADARSVELRYLQKNGEVVWAITTVSLIRDANKPQFFIAQIQNITKRKKFEEQIVKYAEELKLLNAAKDKFFSIISHDLRSPFNSLLGLTEYISQSYDEMTPQEIRSSVTSIYQSSKQVYNLILNLLEWSMIQTGRLTVNKSVINLVDLGIEMMDLYSESANQKRIELINSMKDDILIYADKYMIDTILRNFVSNAIKFTNPGGKIIIKGMINGDNAEISVTDTGIGISPEDQKNLFRIDEQIKRDGTANEKGTGLGLILCKEFSEKNGGVLWVESEEGKGSRFSVTLPRYLGHLKNLESQ